MSPERDATRKAISTIGLPARSGIGRSRLRQLHEHRRHVADRAVSMPGHRSGLTHVIRPGRRNRHSDARSLTRVHVVGSQHRGVDRDHLVA